MLNRLPPESYPVIDGGKMVRRVIQRHINVERRLNIVRNYNPKYEFNEQIRSLIKYKILEPVGPWREHRHKFYQIQEPGKELLVLPFQMVINLDKNASKTGSVRACLDTTETNKLLHRGVLQLPSLSAILLNWRASLYYTPVDIQTMFWQIQVDDNESNLQHANWRFEADEPLTLYRHQRMIIGNTASQNSAILCVKKKADINKAEFPRVKDIIDKKIHADDVNPVGNGLKQAIQDTINIGTVLTRANFEMRKVVSDNWEIIKALHPEMIHPSISDSTVFANLKK